MVKRQPNTTFVFKTFRYYLQNGALIMGYPNISGAIKIFHQVALLATMCFCLISTPDINPGQIPQRKRQWRQMPTNPLSKPLQARRVERLPLNGEVVDLRLNLGRGETHPPAGLAKWLRLPQGRKTKPLSLA